MNLLRTFLAMTLAVALATAFIGWWTVPLVALGWTLASPRRGGALLAAMASAAGWVLLLLVASRSGAVGTMAELLGQILGVAGSTLIALTVAYAALLGGSAALMAQALRPPVGRASPRT